MNKPYSCDTFIVQRDASEDGRMIFGKNSDRPVGEVQPLRSIPLRTAGGRLNLAYTSIPDEGALAHIGSSPFWCWGHEIGLNEYGVAIGNEAQFTRSVAHDIAAASGRNPASTWAGWYGVATAGARTW